MKKVKTCPFCGEMPAITEHAPKIYGRYQWQIGCESSRCCFNPTMHFLEGNGYQMLELSLRSKGGNKMKECPLRTKMYDRNCVRMDKIEDMKRRRKMEENNNDN